MKSKFETKKITIRVQTSGGYRSVLSRKLFEH